MSMLRCVLAAARTAAPTQSARRCKVAKAGPTANEQKRTPKGRPDGNWRAKKTAGKDITSNARPVICSGVAFRFERQAPLFGNVKTLRFWSTMQDSVEKYRYELSLIADGDAINRAGNTEWVEAGCGFTFIWWTGLPLVFKGLSPEHRLTVTRGQEYGFGVVSFSSITIENKHEINTVTIIPLTGMRFGWRTFTTGVIAPVGFDRKRAWAFTSLTSPLHVFLALVTLPTLYVLAYYGYGGMLGYRELQSVGGDDPEFLKDYMSLQEEFRRHQSIGNTAVASHIFAKMCEMYSLKKHDGVIPDDERRVLMNMYEQLEDPNKDRYRLMFGMKTDSPLWVTDEDTKPSETPADAIIRRTRALQEKMQAAREEGQK